MSAFVNELQREFGRSVRRLLATRRAPGNGGDPTAPAGPSRPLDLLEWKSLADLGCLDLLVSADSGGLSDTSVGVAEASVVAEEMGRSLAEGPFIAASVAASALSASPGHRAMDEGLLERFMAGDTLVIWHLGGPVATDGPIDERDHLRARRAGARVVLDGRLFGVEEAGAAEGLLTWARGPAPDAGWTQVYVQLDQPGVVRTQQPALDLSRRYWTVRFDGVPVDDGGPLSGGIDERARQIDLAATLASADSIGVCRHVFESTLDYCGARFVFGRPLASFQAIKHRFADLLVWLESGAAMVLDAAGRLQAGDPASAHCSATKSYVAERSLLLIQECVQLNGGMGVTWEHELHRYLRRASTNAALFGTAPEHRARVARLAGSLRG